MSRFCERHPETPAGHTIEFAIGEIFDCCRECENKIKAFMGGEADIEMKEEPKEEEPKKPTTLDKGKKGMIQKLMGK